LNKPRKANALTFTREAPTALHTHDSHARGEHFFFTIKATTGDRLLSLNANGQRLYVSLDMTADEARAIAAELSAAADSTGPSEPRA
jgi:hypothetical protein